MHDNKSDNTDSPEKSKIVLTSLGETHKRKPNDSPLYKLTKTKLN